MEFFFGSEMKLVLDIVVDVVCLPDIECDNTL